MTDKKAKRPRGPRAQQWGLRDMFIDRPDGDAGKIMAAVWGNSEAEFGEITAKEAKARQRKKPGRFIKKIAPPPKPAPKK